MKAWLRDVWGAAQLRTSVFSALAARSDAFLQGFLVIVAVALVAGLPAFVLDLAGNARTKEAADAGAARAEVRQALEAAAPALESLGVGAEKRQQIAEAFDLGLTIGTEVSALPTRLPAPVGAAFQAVGGWLSRPFADGAFPLAAAALGTWLGYGVWVMLFAKLLGGRGALHGFFGSTALFAVPHVLDVFGRVPVLGVLLGVVAFVWGIAIYVKATAVSHALSFERAFLAVALPLLILLLVIALLAPVLAGAIAVLLAAGR